MGRFFRNLGTNKVFQVLLALAVILSPLTLAPPTADAAGGPDLVVTDITWTPASPAVGSEVTFRATIKNQGADPSPAGAIHGVLFTVNGTSVSWSDNSTASIAAGASVTVTANGGPNAKATWTATAGTHTVRAFVDDVNRIGESNENNNTFDKSISVASSTGSPDLVVTDITWSPASPQTGNEVTFSAVVKNQGTAATPAGTIHGVLFTVNGTSVSWSDNRTSSIAAGASVTVTATGGPSGKATWTAASGTHTVRAFVDDVNRISESNDTNNTFDKSFAIGAGSGTPDLVVTDVQWTPATPQTGNEVTFRAVIQNQGTAASPAGTPHGVLFTVDGASVSWSDNHTSSIAAGASVTVTATGGPSAKATWTAATGAHTVRAFVDDVNRIPESNDNNNILDESLTVNLPSKPDLVVTDISWAPAAPAAGNSVVFSAVGYGRERIVRRERRASELCTQFHRVHSCRRLRYADPERRIVDGCERDSLGARCGRRGLPDQRAGRNQ
jgi:subtilase family serine protease